MSVDVAVLKGNTAVAGLAAQDFQLFDNSVLQTIQTVAIESIPIDVTVFLDTSPSLGGLIEQLKRGSERVIRRLGPKDRLRILTFGYQIDGGGLWRSPENLSLEPIAIGRISSVYDAILLGLLTRPDSERRHLLLGFTDGIDSGSIVSSQTLLAIAEKSETVFYFVRFGQNRAQMTGRPPNWESIPADRYGLERIAEAAQRSGGDSRFPALFGDAVVDAFEKIVAEFRQRYVLRFVPRGVAPGGYHTLTVKVPGHPDYVIRARRAYSSD